MLERLTRNVEDSKGDTLQALETLVNMDCLWLSQASQSFMWGATACSSQQDPG